MSSATMAETHRAAPLPASPDKPGRSVVPPKIADIRLKRATTVKPWRSAMRSQTRC